ncbi:hypothetical protein M9458_029660, partial [Cirrhinus mrigala]
MFETTAAGENWDRSEWARLLGPLLTGEAQRAYFSLLTEAADNYDELKKEILVEELLRALPPSTRQAVGMTNPTTIGELVESIEPAEAAMHRDPGDRAPSFPRRVVQERRTPEGTQRAVHRPAAPGPVDEPMPTEDPAPPTRTWLAGCIIHREPPRGAPRAEVKINGRAALALLDSGSSMSLVQAAILSLRKDSKSQLPITCIHGDTQHVPARRVTISAAPGAWPVVVRILRELPVPVLLEREWPGFKQLLRATTQPANPAGSCRERRASPRSCRPALLASDSGRDAQLEDDRLKHCWSQVRVIENQEQQPAPHPLPHFIVKNGLLGEVKELLVVPKGKVEMVMKLAHAHPMAGHLGAANTIQRIRDRFHWPGLDGDVKLPSPQPTHSASHNRGTLRANWNGPGGAVARGHEHILVIGDYATR